MSMIMLCHIVFICKKGKHANVALEVWGNTFKVAIVFMLIMNQSMCV